MQLKFLSSIKEPLKLKLISKLLNCFLINTLARSSSNKIKIFLLIATFTINILAAARTQMNSSVKFRVDVPSFIYVTRFEAIRFALNETKKKKVFSSLEKQIF